MGFIRVSIVHLVGGIILAVPPAGGWSGVQNRPDPATVSIVYRDPRMTKAVVRAGIVFDASTPTPLALDAYLPRGLRRGERRPAIVFVSGAERVRHWRWFVTYGQLAAAHGMVGIIPDKRYTRGFDGTRAGFEDTEKLLSFLRSQADLGVDPERMCLWTFSAGGRLTAVGLQPNGPAIRCIVSFYGMLDMSGEVPRETGEADRDTLMKRYSPVQALESLIASGRKSPPIFVARAGKDSAVLNNGIDRFASAALRLNVSLTLVNYDEGDHGFDGLNDTAQARAIIKAAMQFVLEQTGAR